jgi:putative CocE/NonD family hydrolase
MLLVAAPLGAQATAPVAVTTSEYVTTRDGTRLAVDVHLPASLSPGQQVPALLELTRYWRAAEHAQTGARLPSLGALDRFFLRNGYAVVKVDARGSGASFGTRPAEYGPQEVRDGWDVVEWIVKRPWSTGRVGAYGTSYSGTTAELLAASGHPAVRAVIPGWSDFDVYRSPARPYGLETAFIAEWGQLVAAMDRNDASVMRAKVRRVDADTSARDVEAAVADHARNPQVGDWARRLQFRDDRLGDGPSWEELGPIHWKRAIEQSKVPMLVLVSWLDAGTTEGALDRLRSFSNPQTLVIMASAHGAGTHASPWKVTDRPVVSDPTPDSLAALRLAFFDHHLKGARNGVDRWPRIRYYTLGSEDWRETPAWPPSGVTPRRFHLDAGGALADGPPSRAGRDDYLVDFGVHTGANNRWATQMGRPVLNLHDRAIMDARMLTYTTPAMEDDVHVVGTPVIDVRLSSTHRDGALLVYLEDVDPTGQVRYLTEGGMRLLHRRLTRDTLFGVAPYQSFARRDAEEMIPGQVERVTFRLHPIAVVIRRGHRLRLAIAGADSTALERIPSDGTPTISIHRDPGTPSFLDLPVRPPSPR